MIWFGIQLCKIEKKKKKPDNIVKDFEFQNLKEVKLGQDIASPSVFAKITRSDTHILLKSHCKFMFLK